MNVLFVRMSFGTLLMLSLLSGCNNYEDQGAPTDGNNELEQMDAGNTGETEEQGETGFPFSLLPDDEGQTNPDEAIDEFIPEDEIGRERDDATEIEPDENQESDNDREEEGEGTNNENDATGMEEEVVTLTNAEREKEGLSPLKQDSNVAEVAQAKSEDMSNNDYFAHRSPNYGSPFDMLEDYNVEFTIAAENIAQGQQTADQVVEGWMNSEGHRKNIMNPNLTHIGIGFEENGKYWTQMFIGK
ncbi:putative YkwD family protein [Salibacterium salarium]|uniref:CAP domain-containing protein n=1 Tax=Salibacterium salarium TaxID=284579 RepID=UPI0027879203|nr:CAP domain-containing protein [Salibacterium salarium]MDQ0300717.1 putative YkwD family protein [Salibacterium salarium]